MMRPCDLAVPCLRVPAAGRIVEALRPPPLLYTSPKGVSDLPRRARSINTPLSQHIPRRRLDTPLLLHRSNR